MNNQHKTRNLIIAVIFLLVGLIIIQFLWIYKAAINQEKQFEYTVVSAINKAIVVLDKQEAVCTQVTNCFDVKGLSCCEKHDLSVDKWQFIDSLITSELNNTKVYLDYEFQLSTEPHPHQMDEDMSEHKCFTVKTNIITADNKHIWLHITFPERNKFILAQIGWLFLLSIGLIICTIIAFLIIYRYYRQEQLLASDTRNFINNLTHEFKTPLASIRLATNRIVKIADCSEKTAPYTKIIHQENNKLDMHINYLLDISRLQKGKMPMNFEPLDINEQLKYQADSFKLKIEDREGFLTLDLSAAKNIVSADCFHFSNAVNNILDNACKYSHEAPKITISTKNKNGVIVIAMSDKGMGIDKADQKTIFQEFSRVNTGDIHNIKGFGLGLSYVAQVIKMHKGNLYLKSKIGEGSTFFIELPVIDKA